MITSLISEHFPGEHDHGSQATAPGRLRSVCDEHQEFRSHPSHILWHPYALPLRADEVLIQHLAAGREAQWAVPAVPHADRSKLWRGAQEWSLPTDADPTGAGPQPGSLGSTVPVVAPRAGAQVQGAHRHGTAHHDVQVRGGGKAAGGTRGYGTRGTHVHDLHSAVRLRLDRTGSPAAVAIGVPAAHAGNHHEQVERLAGAVLHLHPAVRVPLATAILSHGHRHPLPAAALPGEVLPHLRRTVQGLAATQSRGALDAILHLMRYFLFHRYGILYLSYVKITVYITNTSSECENLWNFIIFADWSALGILASRPNKLLIKKKICQNKKPLMFQNYRVNWALRTVSLFRQQFFVPNRVLISTFGYAWGKWVSTIRCDSTRSQLEMEAGKSTEWRSLDDQHLNTDRIIFRNPVSFGLGLSNPRCTRFFITEISSCHLNLKEVRRIE